MDKPCSEKPPKVQNPRCYGEASSKWEFINMTEQEEDIICRMHRLVGDKWELIAGRIPGRTAEEIERFWSMRNSDSSKSKRIEQQRRQNS